MDALPSNPLADLRDIMVPSLEASTSGQFLLPLLVICSSLCALLIAVRRWRYPWRQDVLSELRNLHPLPPDQRTLRLHQLLRRLAMCIDPQSASMSGDTWKLQLDTLLHTRYFSRGKGSTLVDSLYRASAHPITTEILRDIHRLVSKRTRWPW